MIVNQVYDFTNKAVKQAIGESVLLQEDLGNVVDVGNEIFNSNNVDNYVKSLIDVIGKTICVDKSYEGSGINITRDAWEYGSVLQKIRMEMPQATKDERWDLQNGVVYETNMFIQPNVRAKYFNQKDSFQVKMSITRDQVKESFTNAMTLERFISMIFTNIENAIRVRLDELTERCVNNAIAELCYYSTSGGASSLSSGAGTTQAINLLYLYEQETGDTTLTKATCIYNKAFLRFAVAKMNIWKTRLYKPSKLFNLGGVTQFSKRDSVKGIILSEFKENAKVFLYSDTFNKEEVKIDDVYMETPYWQGSGTDYGFSSTSKLHVITTDNHTFEDSGIIGLLFDKDALMVANEGRKITTNYNGNGDFTTYWYHVDSSMFNDFNENMIVFYVDK